ncbi:MAG: hypothetical protein ACRCXZ_03335 [Patescibacteria group bacterium]
MLTISKFTSLIIGVFGCGILIGCTPDMPHQSALIAGNCSNLEAGFNTELGREGVQLKHKDPEIHEAIIELSINNKSKIVIDKDDWAKIVNKKPIPNYQCKTYQKQGTEKPFFIKKLIKNEEDLQENITFTNQESIAILLIVPTIKGEVKHILQPGQSIQFQRFVLQFDEEDISKNFFLIQGLKE